MLEWCQTSNHREAWALQYNQHLGKTLLVAVDQPKPSLDLATDDSSFQTSETGKSRASACTPSAGGPGQYTVVNCGASGHNIRSGCTLKSSPVGVLHLSAIVTAVDDVMNEDGTWIRLDEMQIIPVVQDKVKNLESRLNWSEEERSRLSKVILSVRRASSLLSVRFSSCLLFSSYLGARSKGFAAL